MDRKQLIAAWVVGSLMILELLGFLFLAYFAKFAFFISLFVNTLKMLSPFFLWFYAVFFILIMFAKGQEFTIETWKADLRESFKFFIVSLVIALLVMAACAFMGALLSFLLRRIYDLPAVQSVIASIREWVAATFY